MYDRDNYGDGREDGNEICGWCHRPFWMNHATDTGNLCDDCCRSRDQNLKRVAKSLRRVREIETTVLMKK